MEDLSGGVELDDAEAHIVGDDEAAFRRRGKGAGPGHASGGVKAAEGLDRFAGGIDVANLSGAGEADHHSAVGKGQGMGGHSFGEFEALEDLAGGIDFENEAGDLNRHEGGAGGGTAGAAHGLPFKLWLFDAPADRAGRSYFEYSGGDIVD